MDLSGHRNPDLIVKEELFIVGVDRVEMEFAQSGPVNTKIMGVINWSATSEANKIFLFRDFRCWIAKGEVPIYHAERLRNARYGDHCLPGGLDRDCKLSSVAVHKNGQGKMICVKSEEDKRLFFRYHNGELDDSPSLKKVVAECIRDHVYVDTEEQRDAMTTSVSIPLYHITSLAGLKVFVEILNFREV